MGKSITNLSSVTTVGLDLAKHVFLLHAIDAFGRVFVARRFGARTCWPSSRTCPSVLSVWKPAVALANKMARIAFAIMRGKTTYSAAPA
jgi:hypothetical protein